MKRTTLMTLIGLVCGQAIGNTVIDVGVGEVPQRAPFRGGQWSQASYCVDINDSGQAACRAVSVGPAYRCTSYSSSKCYDSVSKTHLWDGVQLIDVSAPDQEGDEPLVIDAMGVIGGSVEEPVPGNSAWKQRRAAVWREGMPVELLDANAMVLDMNLRGDRVLSEVGAPMFAGAHAGYSIDRYFHVEQSRLLQADGTVATFGGVEAVPVRINEAGRVVGKQILQAFVSAFSSATGDEVPEVSGIGWLLDQATVDALPVNEVGELDVKSWELYPAGYIRPATNLDWMIYDESFSVVGDMNELGDFVLTRAVDTYQATNHFRFKGYYCSEQPKVLNNVTLPFRCDLLPIPQGFVGSFATGTNNLGDVVGFVMTNATTSQRAHWQPTVWLRDRKNRLIAYAADDLLPANSGMTVHEVNAINNHREVAATCITAAGETHGCILDITRPAVPVSLARPLVAVTAPADGQQVSGQVVIEADAFDRNGWIERVVFKVDGKFVGKATEAPYRITWDSSRVAPGSHSIRAIALDNEGRSRAATIRVTVVADAQPPTPTPPNGGNGGDAVVEGEGTITALGSGYVMVSDGNKIYYDAATTIKFNDVADFAVGLPIQYKAVWMGGQLKASALEVN